MKEYSRSAYRERTIPARQNPSKNLSVLNMVTFTESATVSPNIKMNMTEKSSTGRRPTLKIRKYGETVLKARMDIMLDSLKLGKRGTRQAIPSKYYYPFLTFVPFFSLFLAKS